MITSTRGPNWGGKNQYLLVQALYISNLSGHLIRHFQVITMPCRCNALSMLGNEEINYSTRVETQRRQQSDASMPHVKIHQVQGETIADLQPAPRHHLMPWSPVDGEATAPPSAVRSSVAGWGGSRKEGLKSGGISAVSVSLFPSLRSVWRLGGEPCGYRDVGAARDANPGPIRHCVGHWIGG